MAGVMIFIDGPNLGVRYDLGLIIERVGRGREIVATCFYDSGGPETKTDYHRQLEGFGFVVTLVPRIRKKEFVDSAIIADMFAHAYGGRFDTAILVGGDVDYTYAVRRIRELGKRVEVVGFPASSAGPLQEAANEFYDLRALVPDIQRRRRLEQ